MLEGFLKGLEQPEYIHVLINPLPVYGLGMGLIGLIIGLALQSREARTGALALILIAAASAWPVLHYGQQGYDRVKAMADSEGEKWLGEHKRRAEELIYVFYALGAVALVSIAAEWKRTKAALPLALAKTPFFECILKGRFPVLLDELFQVLGKTLILSTAFTMF
jgi:hypothetical protein